MCKYLEKANALRNDSAVHYNCAQSVLIPFSCDAGMTEECARNISANFGSGMKCGSVCGAVTGGLMVLGLFGVESPSCVNEYYAMVRARCGENLSCSALLRKNAENGGEKKLFCDKLVYDCVEIAAELLRRQGKI